MRGPSGRTVNPPCGCREISVWFSLVSHFSRHTAIRDHRTLEVLKVHSDVVCLWVLTSHTHELHVGCGMSGVRGVGVRLVLLSKIDVA